MSGRKAPLRLQSGRSPLRQQSGRKKLSSTTQDSTDDGAPAREDSTNNDTPGRQDSNNDSAFHPTETGRRQVMEALILPSANLRNNVDVFGSKAFVLENAYKKVEEAFSEGYRLEKQILTPIMAGMTWRTHFMTVPLDGPVFKFIGCYELSTVQDFLYWIRPIIANNARAGCATPNPKYRVSMPADYLLAYVLAEKGHRFVKGTLKHLEAQKPLEEHFTKLNLLSKKEKKNGIR